MNECHFLGNLTRDPELKNLQSGTAVVNFCIATNGRKYKTKDGQNAKETAFLEMEAWDSGAETISKFFKKGDPIIVHCAAKTEQWESEGQKRSRIKFRVNKFEFVPTDVPSNSQSPISFRSCRSNHCRPSTMLSTTSHRGATSQAAL